MVTHSVGDSLDESWALLSDDQLTSLLGSMVDRENIVTINSNSWHAICNSSGSDAIACILVVDWR